MPINEVIISKVPNDLTRIAFKQFCNQSLAACASLLLDESISFESVKRNQFGQPYVDKEIKKKAYLSLSHSGEYVAAMACLVPCGIDIERIKPRPYAEMWLEIRHSIEPNEPASLAEFYQWWTRKEAAWKVFSCQTPSSMKSLPVVCSKQRIYKGLMLENSIAPIGYALTIAHV